MPGTRTPGTPWSREGGGHQAAAPKVASLLPATAAPPACLLYAPDPCLCASLAPQHPGAKGPPGNCRAVPDGREQGQAQPCSPQPSASLLFTFTAKLQVSELYLFICVLVHRKGRWVLTPGAPKRGKGTPRGTKLPKGWVGEESAAPSLQLLCSVLLSASPGWGRAAISGEDSSTAAPRPQNAAEFWIPAV